MLVWPQPMWLSWLSVFTSTRVVAQSPVWGLQEAADILLFLPPPLFLIL